MKRGIFQIYGSILFHSKNGERLTKLLNKTRLSDKSLKHHSKTLVNNGLLEIFPLFNWSNKQEVKIWKITQKGNKFLKKLGELELFLGEKIE